MILLSEQLSSPVITHSPSCAFYFVQNCKAYSQRLLTHQHRAEQSPQPLVLMATSMQSQNSVREPIALIGRSLRFPGAKSPSELWELLCNPRDMLSSPPGFRMSLNGSYHPDGDHHGATNVSKAYFIEQDHRVFDASFFSISPVEAEAMDPQQRILLELVYEAMESAGLTIDGMRGSRTSVFVGVMSTDFSAIHHKDMDTISKYAVTGAANSILSNRISYVFDWKVSNTWGGRKQTARIQIQVVTNTSPRAHP